MTLILVALYLPHCFSPAAAATSFAHPFFCDGKPPHQITAHGSGSGGKWTVQKTASSNLVKCWIRNWKMVGSRESGQASFSPFCPKMEKFLLKLWLDHSFSFFSCYSGLLGSILHCELQICRDFSVRDGKDVSIQTSQSRRKKYV